MLLESQILTSKGNSCPNLKVMHQSLEAHCVQKVESQSLSTTSLVEALDCIKMNHNRKKNNNKVLIDQDIQPLPKLPSANQAPTPKIELSPPEEPFNECWPLLEPKYVNECEKETTV